MKLADLLRTIHDSGEQFDPPKEERLSQYQQVFGDELTTESAAAFVTNGWHAIGDTYFATIADRIAAANPDHADVWTNLTTLAVNSDEEKTSVHASDNENVILVDSQMMLFLWTMNKSHLYGQRLNRGDQLKLICELLLHFATLRYLRDHNLVWPRPKTPPHESAEDLQTLYLFTNMQELFMVAHEMAHLVCDQKSEVTSAFICRGEYPTPYTMLFERDANIDQELYADELAVDLVLNTFPRVAEVQQVVLSAIFLLIRYRLWLGVTASDGDFEFRMWFARNSLFRAKASSCYCDGAAVFLIDLLKELEQTLEPAAKHAAKAFAMIVEKSKGS